VRVEVVCVGAAASLRRLTSSQRGEIPFDARADNQVRREW
jgi:hypothetical protein